MSKIPDKTSLTEQVASLIRDYIDQSELEIGDRLGSESSLCKQFDVSRTTIREALRLLQALEYVRLEPNRGAFVADKNRGNLTSLNKWFLDKEPKFDQLYEVRRIIEPEAAAMAAMRGTVEEKMEIMGALAIFSTQVDEGNWPGCVMYDEYFHTGIVRAAHNEILLQMNNIITENIRAYRSRTLTMQGIGESTVKAHRLIANAIVAGNPDAARNAMLTHIEEYGEVSGRLQRNSSQ